MPDIKDKKYFKPKEIKSLWLSTRKEGLHGTEHPGYFQTVNFTTDRNWFIIASAIEIAAVVITIQGGITRSSLGGGLVYLFGAVAAVFVFIALDFIGTQWHHKPVAEKQYFKCDYAIIELEERNVKRKKGILDELAKKSILKTLGILLIILSALLKLFALFLLGTLGIVIVGVMTILYLLVIYIHLFHTGYWFYEYKLRNKIKSQHSSWRNYNRLLSIGRKSEAEQHKGSLYAIDLATFEKTDFLTSDKLWDHEEKDTSNHKIKIGLNKISFVRKVKDKYRYEIETNGLFTDDEIKKIINSGNGIERNKVALYCLKHQLETINN